MSSGISFACDSCGREVFSCNIVNGMKFCARCYQETFGNQQNKESSELLVNSLAEKDRKIAELQKQLERHNKYFNSFSCDNFDEFADFISTFMLTPHEEQTLIKDLKKQLEEKEKDNQFFKKMYLSEKQKNDNYHTEKYGLDKSVEELRKIKLNPKEKEIYYKGFDNCERQFATHITELQQELKSQPAEIVEKIKKRLRDRLNIIAGYGQMTIDEFSFFVESEFTKDIDDILKEYQK